MDESRLKATSSFASEATINRSALSQTPSPLGQKASLQTCYTDEKSAAIAVQPTSKTKQRLTAAKSTFLTYFKKYWFLAGLAFFILLAWAAPNVARKGGYIRAEWTIKWGAVIIIFLISGLSLRTKILTQTFLRIRLHLLVQVINLIIIPFFVFGLVLLLFKLHVPMNSLVLMGVVIAASTPTTVSSNVVMTKNAKGNEATALMNAAVGNVLGIFISPALVDTFQEPLIEATPENESAEAGGSVDFVSVLKQLGITVLIPLVVGQVIQLIWTDKVAKFKVKFRLADVSSIALLTMVWSVFCDAFYSGSFNAVAATDIVAVCIMNACFYVLFSLLSLFLAYIPMPASVRLPHWIERLRYSREDTVAVMYCGATKTVAMGVPLINVLYESGDPGTVGVLSTPLLLYHVEQLILGNIEVDILKRWVERGQKAEKQMPPERDEEDHASPHQGPPDILVPPRALLSDSPPSSPAETLDVKQMDTKDFKQDISLISPADTLHAKSDDIYFKPESKVSSTNVTKVDSTSRDNSQSIISADAPTTHSSHISPEEHLSSCMTDKTVQEQSTTQNTRESKHWDNGLFNSSLFTANTASISLDASRFSTDSIPPPSMSNHTSTGVEQRGSEHRDY